MDKEENITKMLSSPSKVVGSKQVLKELSAATIRCVIVAMDADADLKKKVVAQAQTVGAKVVYFPSKKKLGEAAGVEVSAACVGILSEEE